MKFPREGKRSRRHKKTHQLGPAAQSDHGLPANYPMTTANYSAQRSALAHALGLGQRRSNGATAAAKATSVSETVSNAPKPVVRPRKVKEEALSL